MHAKPLSKTAREWKIILDDNAETIKTNPPFKAAKIIGDKYGYSFHTVYGRMVQFKFVTRKPRVRKAVTLRAVWSVYSTAELKKALVDIQKIVSFRESEASAKVDALKAELSAMGYSLSDFLK